MALFYLKSLHIIGFVAWFSGMFYLVRMFVYHREAEDAAEPKKSILKEQFALMENRVYKIIMNPAMMITFSCGIGMLFLNPGYLQQGWMHVKLTLLILLLVYHLYCKRVMKALASGGMPYSSFQFRMMNEVPTIFLVGIVLLAVLRDTVSPLLIFGVMVGFAVFVYFMARLYQKKREG